MAPIFIGVRSRHLKTTTTCQSEMLLSFASRPLYHCANKLSGFWAESINLISTERLAFTTENILRSGHVMIGVQPNGGPTPDENSFYKRYEHFNEQAL